jgi:glycosyltransferase involved in cell wall biosynthesis
MSMKILYVITKGNWGGAQRYVFDLVTHLPQSEFEPTVAIGHGDILPEKLEARGIRVIKIPHLGRDVHLVRDIQVFFELISLFRRERPDIVHLNSSKIGGLGSLAARLAGIKKIIFTVHGFAFNENRHWLQKKLIACISWLTIVFSTQVIFISKVEYTTALGWPAIKKKATLIYNGIESPTFLSREEARTTLAKHIGKPISFFDQKQVVGTIAELTPNKGLDYALEAFQKIPDDLYIIVGQGELHHELEKKIKEEKLDDRVFLTGFIPEASRFMKAFDIFLLPSLKEGMPYVLLEAGLARLPVIATKVGGVSEIIVPETGMLIEPANAAAIEAALREALVAWPHNIEYGEKLCDTIQENFGLWITISKTVALYSDNTI